MSAPLFGNSGFVYTTPGGILRTHALRWPLRDVEPVHRRRRYVRESLDMSVRQVVTIGSGVSEILATIRYEDLPEDLLTMLVHAADGVEIEYREDLRVSSTATPFLLILDDPGTVHLAMDRDRYPSHGEYEVRIRLRRLDGYPPLPINSNRLLNSGFEEGYPGYAPYWDPAPSRNLLGLDAAVVVTLTGSGRYAYIGTVKEIPESPGPEYATPLAHYGLRGGDTVSLRYETAASDGATGSRLAITFYDVNGTALPAAQGTPHVSSETWTPASAAAVQIPATATSWILAPRYTTFGTRRFRNVMLCRGSVALPYEAPSAAVYDPARAHSGNRYAEIVSIPDQTVNMQSNDQWVDVRPGDTAYWGGWAYRVSGDMDVSFSAQNYPNSVTGMPGRGNVVAVGEWTHLSYSRTFRESDGVPAMRIYPTVRGAGTQRTIARFDSLYLRIRRGS